MNWKEIIRDYLITMGLLVLLGVAIVTIVKVSGYGFYQPSTVSSAVENK